MAYEEMINSLIQLIIGKFMLSSLILVISLIVASLVNKALKTYLSNVAKKLKIDETKYTFFRRFVSILIFFFGVLGAISVIPELSSLSFSLFASAGIVAIVLGLAAQQTLGNLLSGITLIFSRPVRIGDDVRIENEYGIVEEIGLRHVMINSWDNKRIIIPNSKINEQTIINYTIKDKSMIQKLDFSISYDSSIDKAKKIIEEEVRKNENFLDKIKDKDLLRGAVSVRVSEWMNSGIQLSVYFWAKDCQTGRLMLNDLRESVKKRFDQEGIEIPFNYTTVVFKKDMEEKKVIK